MPIGNAPLSLAYSPCPNDTFIFAAWTRGLLPDAPPVKVVLDDVEALNEAAREGRYELTKVSYGAIPHLLDRYRILRAGGALGRGCGPLVVGRPRADGTVPALSGLPPHVRIAIPGRLTTAFLLLRLAFGRPIDAVVMRFDRIVDAVARGDVDAGLIIHESRFTYERAGLARIADLGEWWEGDTGRPIPLGAILARRDLDGAAARAIDATIRDSLAFAHRNDAAILPYVREHAFEMDDDVMRAHIALYVNRYSSDLGDDGIAAIETLFQVAATARLIPQGVRPEFV
ncbi:MAG: 1,4-dihydroxy-6-naphthoate synthase [Candidatus Eremiobacteraeota bacterium]|nr:1,4-dihydroxy-6-naphthoate synthase [Candidatus Eremiobacteraeota bacterium]MBC5804397.1 1,4-dihydroxy-6-naphthoate synthase [Candidatus Eremiobacteraeota bacterium]MBC5821150.1 1,4-dihydroxy-6-naphthoate synthase [Candidatus Eremiobacteraeota bacterium]